MDQVTKLECASKVTINKVDVYVWCLFVYVQIKCSILKRNMDVEFGELACAPLASLQILQHPSIV